LWWHYSQLTLLSTTRTDRWGYPKGVMYAITVPPAFGDLTRAHGGHWVVVTVRFNDPRAAQCRPAGPKSARMTKREAIAYCREQLVLQSITRDRPLPATDAGSSPSIDAAIGRHAPAIPLRQALLAL
jgi:hypothetical protein